MAGASGVVGGIPQGAWYPYCLIRPYRRQASSHRFSEGFKTCGVPVGAGLPAMRPVQATQLNQA
ncbi:hypothetical protein GEV38_23330 [Pseudomonas sp. 13159349]|nr:hypothetical protein GEV38_23330 [Pseudomonas sp. 13159349]